MKTKMVEILTSGDISKDFNRLGVQIRQTYIGEEYSIHEVTEREFEKLCNEPDIENTWINCGWRYSEGSNLGEVNSELIIKNKKLKCWYEPIEEDEDYENEYDDLEEEDYKPEYSSLLEYLEIEKGCSTFRNVCACTIDLAKQNNMKLSELFKLYQG